MYQGFHRHRDLPIVIPTASREAAGVCSNVSGLVIADFWERITKPSKLKTWLDLETLVPYPGVCRTCNSQLNPPPKTASQTPHRFSAVSWVVGPGAAKTTWQQKSPCIYFKPSILKGEVRHQARLDGWDFSRPALALRFNLISGLIHIA